MQLFVCCWRSSVSAILCFLGFNLIIRLSLPYIEIKRICNAPSEVATCSCQKCQMRAGVCQTQAKQAVTSSTAARLRLRGDGAAHSRCAASMQCSHLMMGDGRKLAVGQTDIWGQSEKKPLVSPMQNEESARYIAVGRQHTEMLAILDYRLKITYPTHGAFFLSPVETLILNWLPNLGISTSERRGRDLT